MERRIEQDSGGTAGIAVAIVSITAVGLGISLAIPLLSLTLERRGVPAGWIGINAAFFGLASMLATPFVPRLAARFGTKPALAASVLAGAATLPFFYLIDAFWVWFLLRLISGTAVAVTFVLSEFWIAAAAPQARRGLVMGIYATSLSVGLALGPAVLVVTGTEGILPFLAGAGVIGFAAVPVLVARVSSPTIDGHARGAFARFLVLAPAATAAALVVGLAESGSFALLPVYGSRLGHPAETVILFAAAMTLGNVALQIPLGMLSDRVDRRWLLFAFALAGLAGMIALPFVADALVPTLVLLFVWGGFIGGLYTVGLAHLAQRFNGADLVAANSAFVFCYSAGALIGPAALGFGIEASDPHGYAIVLGACFLAYLCLLAVRIGQARADHGASGSGST